MLNDDKSQLFLFDFLQHQSNFQEIQLFYIVNNKLYKNYYLLKILL